jgi:dTDP-4-amino-4,6-dideoxygalactose transaminase
MRKAHGLIVSTGREAISIVLASLRLRRDDEVWIVTTFDLPNVSSCVTSTVFNTCKPSRVLSERTRAILVIHEFGVAHPDTPLLADLARRRSIPLIEDCAHTRDSRNAGWKVGTLGDYVILSFPKIFPAQCGGALLSDEPLPSGDCTNHVKARQAISIVLDCWRERDEYSRNRRDVFRRLSAGFRQLGYSTLFEVTDEVTPWFFPAATRDCQALLDRAQKNNVDCSLWHGSEIVVFPCHQFLTGEDIDRIIGVGAEAQLESRYRSVDEHEQQTSHSVPGSRVTT